MKQITEELLGRDFSSETISRYAGQLDSELDAWRNRSFTEDYSYIIVDARYDKCRIGSKITDIAVLKALGIVSAWVSPLSFLRDCLGRDQYPLGSLL